MNVDRSESSPSSPQSEPRKSDFRELLAPGARPSAPGQPPPATAAPPRPGAAQAAAAKPQGAMPQGKPRAPRPGPHPLATGHGTPRQVASAQGLSRQGASARQMPRQVASAQLTARSAAHVASASALDHARQGHVVEAHRLAQARAESGASHHERTEGRVRELVAKELELEPGGANPKPRSEAGDALGSLPRTAEAGSTAEVGARPAGQARSASEATARLAAVQEVVEKIELFVRASRPGLTLSLNSGFAAQAQVEKTGPGEVAVRLIGHAGPPRPEELSHLREQLAARGLKLSALSVG